MRQQTALLSAMLLSSVVLLSQVNGRVRAQLDETADAPSMEELMMEELALPKDEETPLQDSSEEERFAAPETEEMSSTSAYEQPSDSIQTSSLPRTTPAPKQEEALRIKAGDILEILPVHQMEGASYAWILTQERKFIQADRSKIFKIRLIEPGAYTLTAEVTSADKTRKVRTVFTLNVEPRTPGFVAQTDNASNLVATLPVPSADGTVALGRELQTLLLQPTGNLRPLNIDIDAAVDSDKNGNPKDDVDNVGSLMQTDSTAMLLWFLETVSRKEMIVTALRPDGTLQTQSLVALGFEQAREQGALQGTVGIQVAEVGPGNYQFSPTFVDGTKPDAPLLYRWTFSDGAESLETQPTHLFEGTGPVTVTLSVRNLMTGQDIGSANKTVERTVASQSSALSASGAVTTSVASSASSVEIDQPPAPRGSIIATVKPFIPLFAAFAGALVIGMIGVAVLSAVRRKKNGEEKNGALQKHFAEMESKLVSKQQTAPVVTATVVKNVATPPESIAEREKAATFEPKKPDEQSIRTEAAPSWLKQGLQGKPAATPSTPKQEPIQKPAEQKPAVSPPKPAAPAPAVQQKPVTPTPASPTPTPKSQSETPKPTAPSVTPPVTPPPASVQKVATPAAPSAQTVPAAATPPPAAPKPVIAPATPAPAQVTSGPSPSWLKQDLQGKPDLPSTPSAAPAPSAEAPKPAAEVPKEDPTVAVIKVENLGKQP